MWALALGTAILLFSVVSGLHQVDLMDDIKDEKSSSFGRYTIEGRVYSPELLNFNDNWQKDTAVNINDGEYVGFLKQDGSFVINNLPSGSYVVDIINPEYLYESVSANHNQRSAGESIMVLLAVIHSTASRSTRKASFAHAN